MCMLNTCVCYIHDIQVYVCRTHVTSICYLCKTCNMCWYYMMCVCYMCLNQTWMPVFCFGCRNSGMPLQFVEYYVDGCGATSFKAMP